MMQSKRRKDENTTVFDTLLQHKIKLKLIPGFFLGISQFKILKVLAFLCNDKNYQVCQSRLREEIHTEKDVQRYLAKVH